MMIKLLVSLLALAAQCMGQPTGGYGFVGGYGIGGGYGGLPPVSQSPVPAGTRVIMTTHGDAYLGFNNCQMLELETPPNHKRNFMSVVALPKALRTNASLPLECGACWLFQCESQVDANGVEKDCYQSTPTYVMQYDRQTTDPEELQGLPHVIANIYTFNRFAGAGARSVKGYIVRGPCDPSYTDVIKLEFMAGTGGNLILMKVHDVLANGVLTKFEAWDGEQYVALTPLDGVAWGLMHSKEWPSPLRFRLTADNGKQLVTDPFLLRGRGMQYAGVNFAS